MGRALACLAEAIALAPWLASLYTNRAHIFETLHRSEEALLDAEQAISLAPDWPKAHLRAARSMISLERHGEALAALEAALRHAPGAPVLMEAAAEARLLLRMQRRDERALASTSSVGDTDLVGIPRGRCCARTKVGAGGSGAGEECACPAYVQRHRSMKIQLDGRWGSPRTCPALAPHLPRPRRASWPPRPRLPVPDLAALLRPIRHDNQPELLLCLRCGHEAHRHLNLIHARDSELNARDRQPPPREHKPAGGGGGALEPAGREQEGLGREGANPVLLEDASGTLV